MTPEEAVAEIHRLQDLAGAKAKETENAAASYGAYMALYNVAIKNGDMKQASVYRDTIHSCVDVILDAAPAIFDCEQKVAEIVRDASRQM